MKNSMKSAAIVAAFGLAAACTSDPPPAPNIVEVLGGQSPVQRLEIGASVLKSLAKDGLPDLSCTGDAAKSRRCEDAVTPCELLVRVVHNEDMSRVYIECKVSDSGDHPDLMNSCLTRVRTELNE